MTKKDKIVSIIIPSFNEKKYIGRSLDSIIVNDYPKENFEVLVVDGMSEDGTREVVRNYIKKYPSIKILDNPQKFTNFAFNIGIKNAKGEIIIFGGAHAVYEKDYISKCVKYLKEYDADNVGGVLKTVPLETTITAKAIAISLSHPFGAGTSYFRTGVKKPKSVDTVFGGCYKKEVFNKIGLFNENLTRSQDMEFNLRLKKAGGKILLAPEIVAYYYPNSNLKDFFFHNFKDGIWAIYPLKFIKTPLSLRHYIPFIFVLSLLITALLGIFFPFFIKFFLAISGFYLLIALCFSIEITVKEKNIVFLFLMPVVFITRHIGYGLGSILGALKLIV
jgi:glycosyltransferase involved in cell wall biosynthesis